MLHSIHNLKDLKKGSRLSRTPNLQAFLKALDEAEALIAFNGKDFDIPFIQREFKVCSPSRSCFHTMVD